jgi:Sulfotransferase domain
MTIGGTQALVQYLYQHPMIAPREGRNEEHFFNSESFVRDENGIPVERNQKEYGRRFQQNYPKLFEATDNNNSNNNMIAIDNTPYYLFGSERIPSAVLCVAPWVKLLAILRNPVDRVESQYHYLHQNRQLHYKQDMVDWEVWVNHDIQLLQTAGVLQDWNVVDFETFAGSEVELLAWKRYVRSAQNSMFLVGRGLYVIQLQHWYQAIQRAGKPTSDLMVIHAEAMRNSTQSVYNDIIQFLDLPPFVLSDSAPKHETIIKSALPMPESIRKNLKKLYKPYNQRLYKMLGWGNVWD